MEPKLIAAMKRALATFSAPAPGEAQTSLLHNASYPRIVNANHFKRVSKLLEGTKGEVVVGGKTDAAENKIEVTIVRNVKGDDSLMSGARPSPFLFSGHLVLKKRCRPCTLHPHAEEIFGPVLPIVTLPDVDSMIRFIQDRETPLALYVFTQSNKKRQHSASFDVPLPRRLSARPTRRRGGVSLPVRREQTPPRVPALMLADTPLTRLASPPRAPPQSSSAPARAASCRTTSSCSS